MSRISARWSTNSASADPLLGLEPVRRRLEVLAGDEIRPLRPRHPAERLRGDPPVAPLGTIRAPGEGELQRVHPVRGERRQLRQRVQGLGDERRVEAVRREVVAERLLEKDRTDERLDLLRRRALRLQRAPRPSRGPGDPLVVPSTVLAVRAARTSSAFCASSGG